MTALQERAMLVYLRLDTWTGKRSDHAVVDEVARTHAAAGRQIGTFSKNLIDPEALKPITQTARRSRADHYDLSLPFDDTGRRLLPAAAYEGYCALMRTHRQQFERRCDDFLRRYDLLIAGAQRTLGTLYRRNEYPSADRLADRFRFRTKFEPIPDSGHFVVEVAAEQKPAIDQDTLEAVERAAADVWQRVHNRARTLAEGLRGYADEHGEVMRNFRQSRIENVRYLVQLLPKLNFTGDPRLDQMTQRLDDELCQFDADALKASSALRNEVATKAEAVKAEVDQILDTMDAYL